MIVRHNLQGFLLIICLVLQDIPEKAKVVLVYVSLLVMSVPPILYMKESDSDAIKGLIRSDALNSLMPTVLIMILSLVFKFALKSTAYSNFEMEKQGVEIQIILDNVGEAVITHSDNGIHFVNKSALQLLRSTVQ